MKKASKRLTVNIHGYWNLVQNEGPGSPTSLEIANDEENVSLPLTRYEARELAEVLFKYAESGNIE